MPRPYPDSVQVHVDLESTFGLFFDLPRLHSACEVVQSEDRRRCPPICPDHASEGDGIEACYTCRHSGTWPANGAQER